MPLLNRRLTGVVLVFLAMPALAQEEVTFRSDTRLVLLHATVFDRSGNMVTTLPREAFKVTENGVEQPLRIFRREDIPISLGLVVDNSGSMKNKRQKVEAAAIALVKSSKRLDEVFIVNFNEDSYLDVPFTGDVPKMEEGIARIDSRGGTAMRDAVSMSIDHLRAEGKKDKKVLLIITDGNDTASGGITLEKLVEKAQKSEVLIYAIGILSEEDRREAGKAKRALNALAAASGGMAYFPQELSEVESMANRVAIAIRNQYTIAYSPTNQNLDGSFRQIKVSAGSRYNVRTRTGYYATPDPGSRNRGGPPGGGDSGAR
jgi:VWFA-related protein